MVNAKIILGIIFTVYLIILFTTYKKSKKTAKLFLLVALQGICAFFAVNLIGQFIDVHIPVNKITLTFSSLFGVSGVIMLLIFQVFLS